MNVAEGEERRDAHFMGTVPESTRPVFSATHGRLCVVLAAVLWSTSGGFTKLLTKPTALHLNEPELSGLQIAFARVLFAGLALAPLLRRRDLAFRPAMLGTAITFAAMNALFVSALAMGPAANAILLQYTAPMWMYVVSVWWLREPADRRGAAALAIGMAGIGLIVAGGFFDAGQVGQLPVILLALGSGVTYAGVLIGLRVLRDLSSRWLTVFNQIVSAAVLLPFVWGTTLPTPRQLVILFLYGSLQLALPYWLVARGLRRVSPQEAGTLTLLEPLLNPLWAYLVSPATESPSLWTLAGGCFILGALAYRYWPLRPVSPDAKEPS
jgi:drug/metabolite transporter, DME family